MMIVKLTAIKIPDSPGFSDFTTHYILVKCVSNRCFDLDR